MLSELNQSQKDNYNYTYVKMFKVVTFILCVFHHN